MDRKRKEELQQHMLRTYFSLRIALVLIGIALPLVVLFSGGLLRGTWFQRSISAYYHLATPPTFLTTRDLFVGGLIAAAVCLYAYKGYSTRENVALNLAAVFALLVALFPTVSPDSDGGFVEKVHLASAVLFFFCIAYVSIRRSHDTLELLPTGPKRKTWYSTGYIVVGLMMIFSPIVAIALSYAVQEIALQGTVVFWAESVAVWAFAAYWLLKTFEMSESHAERRTVEAKLKREVVDWHASIPGEAAGPIQVNPVSRHLINALAPKGTLAVPNRGPSERVVEAETIGADSPIPLTPSPPESARQ